MSAFEAVSLPADLLMEAEDHVALQELAGQLDEVSCCVYALLLDGCSREEIRRRLHLGKRRLRRAIDRIRSQYIRMFSRV